MQTSRSSPASATRYSLLVHTSRKLRRPSWFFNVSDFERAVLERHSPFEDARTAPRLGGGPQGASLSFPFFRADPPLSSSTRRSG